MTASGRTLSRIARVTARGQAVVYLALLPACGRRSQDGWSDEKPRRVLGRLPRSLLWFLKRRRLSLLLQEGRFSPCFRLFCRVLPGVFEPVRILFPVAIGGIAGMTASAAGSGGAVCPSTAAGGAVIFFCVRLRRLLVLGSFVPVDFCDWGSHCWCCDCDACWSWWSACSRCCAWRAWSYAVSGGFPL